VGSLPPDATTATYNNAEGPVWVGGALYLSNFQTWGSFPGRILRYVPGDAIEELALDTHTNGLAVDGQGDLVVAKQSDHSISRLSLLALGAPTVITSNFNGTDYLSPNDLVISTPGHIYFSDPNWQSGTSSNETYVYHWAPSGIVTRLDQMSNPNGVTLSLDESVLYVTALDGLYRFAVAPNGTVTTPATKMTAFSGGGDGMAIDCAGNLYVTGDNRVQVIDPVADVELTHIDVSNATNVAFGGSDAQTLFITAQNPPMLMTATSSLPGLPY
jgi:gluconolactonase